MWGNLNRSMGIAHLKRSYHETRDGEAVESG